MTRLRCSKIGVDIERRSRVVPERRRGSAPVARPEILPGEGRKLRGAEDCDAEAGGTPHYRATIIQKDWPAAPI